MEVKPEKSHVPEGVPPISLRTIPPEGLIGVDVSPKVLVVLGTLFNRA